MVDFNKLLNDRRRARGELEVPASPFSEYDDPPDQIIPPAPEFISPWNAPSDPIPTFTYLCGPAGSGKTFLTKLWAEEHRGITLCATTGIAALNLGGTTINSLLGYFDTASLQERFTQGRLTGILKRLYGAGLRRLVIDEPG